MTAVSPFIFGTLALFGMSLFGGFAQATPHDEPGSGRSFKSPLVTAYRACTNPNTITDGPVPFQACTPPTRVDPLCGFGPPGTRGQGKVKGIARNGDIEITMIAAGLEGCEGYQLCAQANVRITTEACMGPEPCTVTDFAVGEDLSGTTCCVVSNGNCRVKTSVNDQVFGIIQPGQRAGIEVIGCGLKRRTGPGPMPGNGEVTFSCGTLSQ